MTRVWRLSSLWRRLSHTFGRPAGRPHMGWRVLAHRVRLGRHGSRLPLRASVARDGGISWQLVIVSIVSRHSHIWSLSKFATLAHLLIISVWICHCQDTLDTLSRSNAIRYSTWTKVEWTLQAEDVRDVDNALLLLLLQGVNGTQRKRQSAATDRRQRLAGATNKHGDDS